MAAFKYGARLFARERAKSYRAYLMGAPAGKAVATNEFSGNGLADGGWGMFCIRRAHHTEWYPTCGCFIWWILFKLHSLKGEHLNIHTFYTAAPCTSCRIDSQYVRTYLHIRLYADCLYYSSIFNIHFRNIRS